MADPRIGIARQRERALQLSAASQQRARRGTRQANRGRHVTARAAQHRRATPPAELDYACDRVVGAHVDRAIVHEKRVGDRAEALERVLVLVRDRLLRSVPARHHQRRHAARGDVCHQQVVQRRVGEHHAELARMRCDLRRNLGRLATLGQNDRPRAALQQHPLRLVDPNQPARRAHVGDHQRERPPFAVLARAECAHAVPRIGAAREVIAAKALDGDDRAGREQLGRAGDGIESGRRTAVLARQQVRRAAGGQQPSARATLRARDRLRVKAAVARILVLVAALLRTSQSRPSSSTACHTARRARS